MNTEALQNPPSLNPALALLAQPVAQSSEAKGLTPDVSSATAARPEARVDAPPQLSGLSPIAVSPLLPSPTKFNIGVLGAVEELPPEESLALMTNEQIIRDEFRNSIDVGLALVDIRDRRLYRYDYTSFVEYYGRKWHFDRRKVYFLSAIAEIHNAITTGTALPKPEYESQMRPLLGSTPDQVRSAWELAAKNARAGKITPRLVRAAVAELNIKPEGSQDQMKDRQARAERRQQLSQAMADLLELIVMRKPYEELVQKASQLDGHVRFFFPKRPKRG